MPKTESLRHREAFEYYYGMGKDRSLSQVASRFDVTVQAVGKWSSSFNWQERIEQRDIENGKRLAKKTDDTIVETKANYRKIIKACIAQAVEKIRNRELTAATIQDLERLIKTDMLLLGEATERNDTLFKLDLPSDINETNL
jgi:transposase